MSDFFDHASLKEARIKAGYTVYRVSKTLKTQYGRSTTAPTIANYENGETEPTASLLKIFSLLYDRPLDSFFKHPSVSSVEPLTRDV